MDESSKPIKHDPLGLNALEAVVNRLQALAGETTLDANSSKRFALIVEQLTDRFDAVQQKYELLKDRYALLKRSNAALCDELVWLRDQLDDLSTPGD